MSRELRSPLTAPLGAVFLLGVIAFVLWHWPSKTPNPSPWQWHLPQGFQVPWVPQDNPMTEAKFQLGRHLFYDKRLSGDGSQSCASCHSQHLAFTDGRAQSVGITGDITDRSAQSLVNVAYFSTLTWANPALGRLEHQDQVPLFADVIVEMGVNESNQQRILADLKADPYYQQAFAEAFAEVSNPINFGSITYALASFQRGIISADAKYDRVRQGKALYTALERKGHELFYGKAQCAQCHSGVLLSDHTFDALSKERPRPFHNTGLYNLDGKGAYPANNMGLMSILPGAQNMGKFRAPSLRNIALTAPYMHDGSIRTLEEVIDHYARQGRKIDQGPYAGDGRDSPLKDPIMREIDIQPGDKAALIAFLNTLTDTTLLTNPRFADPFAEPSQVRGTNP